MLERNIDFDKDIINHQGIIVMMLTAHWDQENIPMTETLIKLHNRNKNILPIIIDVDKNKNIDKKYRDMPIPSFHIFNNGSYKEYLIGCQYLLELENNIQKIANK